MNKLLIAVTGAMMGFAGSALAADLAPPPAEPISYDWTGFYIGGNVGYGFDGKDDVHIKDNFFDVDVYHDVGSVGTLNRQGVFGGGQLGYNFEVNGFVFGVEGDIEASGIGDSERRDFPFPDGSPGFFDAKVSSDITWFGTVRGRIGWAFDTVLLYGTGGVAFGGLDTKFQGEFYGGEHFKGSDSTTGVGWAAGGGVEWAFAPNWSVKFEYQYINLGDQTLKKREFYANGDPIDGVFAKASVTPHFQTVRAGVNWHF